MEPWVEIVTQLGFPITCTLALGYMLFRFAKRWIDDAHEREESMNNINKMFSDSLSKVADTLNESNNINRELSETNRTLVDRVELNLTALNNNVAKILDKIQDKYDDDDGK